MTAAKAPALLRGKAVFAWLAAIAGTALAGSTAMAAGGPAQGWQLDRVVVMMRHGVRPPTKAEPLPATPHQPWPAWDVGWGELSHHGEAAVARLASFDRATYAVVLPVGCPGRADIRAVADSDQRTVRTAQVYVAAMFPGCAVPVEHRAQGQVDPRFSPFEGAPLLSSANALAAVSGAMPQGGLTTLDRQFAPQLAALNAIIACGAADCALSARHTTIAAPAGRIKLAGGLALGASLAETLALEYADGKPLREVGWGRADRATITDLLSLHAAEFALTARPLAIAQAGAKTLLGEVSAALSQDNAPRFNLFVGHDTNLALIGGALALHWHAAQFAADDPPPGGALIFERWRNAAGKYRLAVLFRSQSLDEMRDLGAIGPSAATPVAFAPCTTEMGCSSAELGQAVAGITARPR